MSPSDAGTKYSSPQENVNGLLIMVSLGIGESQEVFEIKFFGLKRAWVILVTTLWWWHFSDVRGSIMFVTFVIENRKPSSKTCHQHKVSPTSGTNMDDAVQSSLSFTFIPQFRKKWFLKNRILLIFVFKFRHLISTNIDYMMQWREYRLHDANKSPITWDLCTTL